MDIANILNKICINQNLNSLESDEVIENILEGQLDDGIIGALLMGLKMKGESISEITSFAKKMREKSQFIAVDGIDVIDTCGTGGDGLGTFNISTVSAIIAAAAGCFIAKHGNKSVSSKCGSADVLEKLGINIFSDVMTVENSIKDLGIGFLFAPKLHSAMKYVMPVRKSLKIRTIFNILGPLTNPARAKKQIIGVFDEKLCSVYANVLKEMGHTEAYIVHGSDGLDEVSTSGGTLVYHLKDSNINSFYVTPEDFGIQRADLAEIKGGSADINAGIILDILNGVKGAKRDVACLNAAFAIKLSGISDTLQDGFEVANQTIDSYKAFKKLEEWRGVC